jgi:hypothetical protein
VQCGHLTAWRMTHSEHWLHLRRLSTANAVSQPSGPKKAPRRNPCIWFSRDFRPNRPPARNPSNAYEVKKNVVHIKARWAWRTSSRKDVNRGKNEDRYLRPTVYYWSIQIAGQLCACASRRCDLRKTRTRQTRHGLGVFSRMISTFADHALLSDHVQAPPAYPFNEFFKNLLTKHCVN